MKKNDVVNAALFWIIFYFSSSLWAINVLSGYIQLVVVFTLTIFILYLNYDAFNRKTVLMLSVMMGCICLSETLHGSNLIQTMIEMVFLFAGFALSETVSFKGFVKIYIYLLFVVCVGSIIGYFCVFLFPKMFDFLPMIERSYGVYGSQIFRNCILCVIPTNMKRIVGFFPEPGVFQIYISYALIFELFVIEKVNSARIIVFFVSLVMTFSTNGYISLAFVVLALFLQIDDEKYRKWCLGIFLMAIIGFVTVLSVNPEMLMKTTIDKFSGNSVSMNDRVDSLISAINTIKDNFFVGCGSLAWSKKGSIQTFTPLNWFAIHGVIYGMICFLGYSSIGMYCKKNVNNMGRLVIAISLLIAITTQAMQKEYIVFVFIFYGLQIRLDDGPLFYDKCKAIR